MNTRLEHTGDDQTYNNRDLLLSFETPEEVEVYDVSPGIKVDDGTWELPIDDFKPGRKVNPAFSIRRPAPRNEVVESQIKIELIHEGNVMATSTVSVEG